MDYGASELGRRTALMEPSGCRQRVRCTAGRGSDQTRARHSVTESPRFSTCLSAARSYVTGPRRWSALHASFTWTNSRPRRTWSGSHANTSVRWQTAVGAMFLLRRRMPIHPWGGDGNRARTGVWTHAHAGPAACMICGDAARPACGAVDAVEPWPGGLTCWASAPDR
jgi:hypothetical protein